MKHQKYSHVTKRIKLKQGLGLIVWVGLFLDCNSLIFNRRVDTEGTQLFNCYY